ncbi:MAG: FAD-binding oxidoreductase, partial [Alphaproteobacteria bacterium]|nr:FAD-binding oxidoreductase [Alphaproteobacteria bacterium]
MNSSQSREADIAVIGGGLVGTAIAWGLARLGQRVVVLDEGDVAYRASRGNFALVWVQSKGLGMARYAAWTKLSSDSWAGLADELKRETTIDVHFQRPGGFQIALSETELEASAVKLKRLHNQPEMTVGYDCEVLDRERVRAMLPTIGPEVVGGIYCPLDGHTNALKLLRALHAGFRGLGGDYRPASAVSAIVPQGGAFRIEHGGGTLVAGKVVLAAGIANARLGPMVGLTVPVRPQRGQVVVTERLQPFLRHPIVTVRQTDEGSVMLGDSQEEAGFDDTVGTGVVSTIAARAVRIFPLLGRANIVRSWAALRVMTKDGF